MGRGMIPRLKEQLAEFRGRRGFLPQQPRGLQIVPMSVCVICSNFLPLFVQCFRLCLDDHVGKAVQAPFVARSLPTQALSLNSAATGLGAIMNQSLGTSFSWLNASCKNNFCILKRYFLEMFVSRSYSYVSAQSTIF